MNVLYLTNIHTPYRDKFFEQLGECCNLTVAFESRQDDVRDASWFNETEAHSYTEIVMPDNRAEATRRFLKLVEANWDCVIVGCYNSLLQIMAVEYMRARHQRYVINSDGRVFAMRNVVRRIARDHVLRGASGYLVAGESNANSMKEIVGDAVPVQSYPLTSLTADEIKRLAIPCPAGDRKSTILCVGQYEPYKGLDVFLEAYKLMQAKRESAERMPSAKIVGMGRKYDEFCRRVKEMDLKSVTVQAFLQPEELMQEYRTASMFVLPSRQECWGLVINEAAACGCPIVSTWGSGAAIDYLSKDWAQFLAKPGSGLSLAHAMESLLALSGKERMEYGTSLQEKATFYSIENCVDAHLGLLYEVGKAK